MGKAKFREILFRNKYEKQPKPSLRVAFHTSTGMEFRGLR